jgi:hypothetical protein
LQALAAPVDAGFAAAAAVVETQEFWQVIVPVPNPRNHIQA